MRINKIDQSTPNFGTSKIRITDANRHTASKYLLVHKCKYFKSEKISPFRSFIRKIKNNFEKFIDIFRKPTKV